MPREPWVKRDRRYKSGYRWTPHAYRMFYLWGALAFAWCFLTVVFGIATNGTILSVLDFAPTAGLIWFGVHQYRNSRRPLQAPQTGYAPPPPPYIPPGNGQSYGYIHQPGYGSVAYIPSTPYAPPVNQANAPTGERNSRVIPQDVKIAVAARDHGRCRQCGSTQELHYDHVIPWSKGGANTTQNIQLLCGPCNRRKGADDIPAAF